MLRFFQEAGPVIFPVLLLAMVVWILTLWNGLTLILRRDAISRRRTSIDAILFWGAVAAVLASAVPLFNRHNDALVLLLFFGAFGAGMTLSNIIRDSKRDGRNA